MTREPNLALEDAHSLLQGAAEYVELTAAREEVQARVVMLARRLTRDWKLTDEEAVRVAGEIAVRALMAPGGDGHGR